MQDPNSREAHKPIPILNPEQRVAVMRNAVRMMEALPGYETVFFLDKTARPLSQFVYDLWDGFYPGIQMPRIDFINIGSEKTNLVAEYNPGGKTRTNIFDRAGITTKIKSLGDIKTIFGEGNTEVLQSILQSGEGGRRLVVDEISQSGNTKLLTRRLLTLADPLNRYDLFTFLDDEQSISPFRLHNRGDDAFVPWQSSGTLVDEGKNSAGFDDYAAFTSTPITSERLLERGRQLLQEFSAISGDIVSNRSVLV